MRNSSVSLRSPPALSGGLNTPTHLKRFRSSIPLYIFLLPAVVYLLLLSYQPMYGVQIAFRDYSLGAGITGSPWVGLKHFITFFESPRFLHLVQNTLTITALSLLTFPLPILLAIGINYCTSRRLAKVVQMISYAPHFISTVVLVGMLTIFLSPSIGFVNTLLEMAGFDRVNFLMIPENFKFIYVGSDLWQHLGWNSVLYIGALASISPELHEAATVDGASIWKRIWHIDLPGISPTIIIMLIMNLGFMMSVGFQKAFLLQNSGNIVSSEIISTYVYKIGLVQSNFSYSTAIDLFNTAINIVLLLTANAICRKTTETSLF